MIFDDRPTPATTMPRERPPVAAPASQRPREVAQPWQPPHAAAAVAPDAPLASDPPPVPLRRWAWLTRWALQAGVPLVVGSLTLVATAWQIGSQLEQSRDAAQDSLAITGNVQMLRAASDYQAAVSALGDYVEGSYGDLSGTAAERADALAADSRYLELQQDVYTAHDEVANSFNELLGFGDPDSIAAARALLAEMSGFDDQALPVTSEYAAAQNNLVNQLCILSESKAECNVKTEH